MDTLVFPSAWYCVYADPVNIVSQPKIAAENVFLISNWAIWKKIK